MPKVPHYEYMVIDCHEIRDKTGIHDKHELLEYILGTLVSNGWRYHSMIDADAFGIKGACPLVILEMEVK